MKLSTKLLPLPVNVLLKSQINSLGVNLSLLRQTADVRVSADISYVYFTHAVFDVKYYTIHI